jgi:hypothetical protein
MSNPTEYFNWWVRDVLTGERRLTPYKLSRVNAQRAFPGATPSSQSREIHTFADPGEIYADGRASDKDRASGPEVKTKKP